MSDSVNTGYDSNGPQEQDALDQIRRAFEAITGEIPLYK